MTPVVVIDVHAEATSEKVALASWLDGRVTAVLGTHTHVQTADARVLPGRTAAVTDVGMTGPHDSVIGVETELAIRRMRTGMPVRFETASSGVRLEGALVTCDPATGRARSSRCAFRGRPREDGQERDERRPAGGDEPGGERVELLHELPVARREPDRGQRAGEDGQPERRAAPGAPTRGTRSTSQTRNCGDSTLLSATNATTAAAAWRTTRSGVAGPRAKATHTSATATTCAIPWSTATTSAVVPVRFWDPLPDAPRARARMTGEARGAARRRGSRSGGAARAGGRGSRGPRPARRRGTAGSRRRRAPRRARTTASSRAALPPGDDAEEWDEDGRVQLDGDPEPDDERARAQPAGGDQHRRQRDERGGEQVEPRQDHAPEEHRSSATAARTSLRSAPLRPRPRTPSARTSTPSAPITAISAMNTAR